MKKLFSILFMLVAVLGLWSCNDDGTDNDALYTVQLPGKWLLSGGNENEPISRQYIFNEDGSFVYGFTSMNIKEATMKTWSVRGAWNVKKGVLQVSYDVDTYHADGYTETEMKQMEAELRDSNKNLAEMNKEGKAYGFTITFNTVDGKKVLQLGGVNGYFEKIGN